MFKKNAFYSFSGKIIYALFFFLFQTLATHLLTIDDFGIFAKWLTGITFGAAVVGLGLNVSSLYSSKSTNNILSNIITNILVYSSTLILLLTIGYFVKFSDFIYLLSTAIYFYIIYDSLVSFYQYKNNFKLDSIFKILKSLMIILSLIPVYFFLDINSQNLMIFFNISLFITIIFLISSMLLAIDFNNLKLQLNYKKEYYIYGLKNVSMAIIAQIIYISDIFLLSYLIDDKAVALYFVGVIVIKIAWFGVDSIGVVLFKKFIDDKSHNRFNYIKLLSQVVFILEVVLFIVTYFMGEFIINILYSEEYLQSLNVILILLVGSHGMVMYKLINRYLAANNDWYPIYKSLIIAAIINIVLNLILIPIYNIVGAAIASAITYIFLGVYLSRTIKQIKLIEYIDPSNLIKKFT